MLRDEVPQVAQSIWNLQLQQRIQLSNNKFINGFLGGNASPGLTVTASTVFRAAGHESLTSDLVMSPNKLFSCDFFQPFWKIKIQYTMYLVRQGVKGGRLYEGERQKLKRTLSYYCACTKLRFSDRMLRIQKIHIVL